MATIVTTGLVRHYRLTRGADDQVAYDDSVSASNGRHGTTTGVDAYDPVWSADGNVLTFVNPNSLIYNQSLVNMPTGNSDLTMMIAARRTGTNTRRNVLGYGVNATRRNPHIHLSNGVIEFGTYFDDLLLSYPRVNEEVPVVATFRYTASSLLLEGIADDFAAAGTRTLGAAPDWGGNSTLHIGSRDGAQTVESMNGDIYYILIYDRKLSDAEVSQNYEAMHDELGTRGVTLMPPASYPAPVIEAADCTNSGNATASTSWGITLPAYSAGDLVVVNLGWDDSVTVTGHTIPNGPGGEVPYVLAHGHNQITETSQRLSAFYWIAASAYAGGTYTVVPTASESWTATVLKVPAGEFDPVLPIGRHMVGGSAEWVAHAPTGPFTTSVDDEGGRLVTWIVVDTATVSAVADGWTEVANVNQGSVVSGTLAVRDSAVGGAEFLPIERFTLPVSETSSVVSYVLRAPKPGLVGVRVRTAGINDVTQYNHSTAGFNNNGDTMYPLEVTAAAYGTSTRWALPIPQGAKIAAVKVFFHESETAGTHSVDGQVFENAGFERSDNAAVLTSGTAHLTAYNTMGGGQLLNVGKHLPVNTSVFSQIGPFDLDPEMLQVVVDRAGWVSGNYARFMTRTAGGDSHIAQWEAHNGTSAWVKPNIVVYYYETTATAIATSDGYAEGTSGWNSTDVELYTGLNNTWKTQATMRFTGVTIPANAVVTDAYVRMAATWPGPGDRPTIVIAADTAASPTLPTTFATWEGKTRTTEKIVWTPDPDTWQGVLNNAPKWQRSGNLKGIVQELVDTHGGYSNGTIQVFYDEPATAFPINRAVAWFSVEENLAGDDWVPQLVVAYTSGSIEATATASLAALTTTASAAVLPPAVDASATASLVALTATASSTRTLPGNVATAALTLPKITSAASATRTAPIFAATATAALPKLTSTASTTNAQPAFAATATAALGSLSATSVAENQVPIAFVPDGDATSSNVSGTGANLWGEVNEGFTAPDDDASYIVNAAAGDASVLFTLTDPPANLLEVTSIKVRLRVKKVLS